MDTVALVENNLDDGQLLVEQFVAAGNSVTVAFWIITAEEGLLFLCIATETVERDGPLAASRAIAASLRKLSDPWVRMTEIKMVGPNDPITKSVLALLARHPGPLPSHFGPQTLGNISVEDVYIYPRKSERVTIYHMVFPGAPVSPVILSLDPFPPNGRNWLDEQKLYQGETGIDCVVGAPEGAKLEWDESGHTVLAWSLRGSRKQSNANEVYSLANLGLQGFRLIRDPEAADEQRANHSLQRN